jgi:NhaP-type Na+/H+ or K+/H+ antiporter
VTFTLIFSLTLLAGVLTSELARRSILSTAVIFLAAGFIAGSGVLGAIPAEPENPLVVWLAAFALFSVLFTDGMRAGFEDLRASWRLVWRALGIGLPLTMAGTAVLAHWITGLPWLESWLLGAILSPTDPVLVSAIVGQEEVPKRLRDLLNVESGLNDGLTLPVILVLLGQTQHQAVKVGLPLEEAVLGIALGATVAWATIRLEESPVFAATEAYRPLLGVAIGLIVLSASFIVGVNEFLAAFAAGVTVSTVSPAVEEAFNRFGELLTELLKLAALLAFGALISVKELSLLPWTAYVFMALALLAVRPAALAVALAGTGLPWREWVTAAWFGPKGFSSVTYALWVVTSNSVRKYEVYHLAALVIVASIVAHSSTDVPVARWFRKEEDAK